MTLPREECFPIVEELLSLYDDLEEASWREGNVKVSHLAHGWYMRVRRGVKAVLMLEQTGFAAEAAPIRRSIIERAVALKWLATEGDAIQDTVKRGHAHGIERLREAIVGADWSSIDLVKFDEVLAELEDADPAHDNMLHFANRVRAYGRPDDVPPWFSETALAHPSYESAIAYWRVPEMQIIAVPDSVDQMGFCMGWLLTATLVFRGLFDPPLWQPETDDLVKRARAIDTRYRAATGLKPYPYPSID
ncbi:MAG TPA: DUF5677 domain-containing protein [Galbitalea sp.]